MSCLGLGGVFVTAISRLRTVDVVNRLGVFRSNWLSCQCFNAEPDYLGVC